MKRKWFIVLGAAVAALAIGSSVYASGSIKLVADGRVVATDAAPTIMNGHTLVPIRAAAEALGADVSWDNGTKTVTVDSKKVGAEDQRVQLLQQALAPASADEAAASWAKWVKSRNGAAQFAVLTAALQGKLEQKYEELNWVTGVSSPWVDSYDVSAAQEGKDGSAVYDVTFKLATSAGDAGSGTVKVTVVPKDTGWFVSDLKIASGADALAGIVLTP